MNCRKCGKPLLSKTDTYIAAYPPGPFVLWINFHHQGCHTGKKDLAGEFFMESNPVRAGISLIVCGALLLFKIFQMSFDGLFLVLLVLFIVLALMFVRDRQRLRVYEDLP